MTASATPTGHPPPARYRPHSLLYYTWRGTGWGCTLTVSSRVGDLDVAMHASTARSPLLHGRTPRRPHSFIRPAAGDNQPTTGRPDPWPPDTTGFFSCPAGRKCSARFPRAAVPGVPSVVRARDAARFADAAFAGRRCHPRWRHSTAGRLPAVPCPCCPHTSPGLPSWRGVDGRPPPLALFTSPRHGRPRAPNPTVPRGSAGGAGGSTAQHGRPAPPAQPLKRGATTYSGAS